MSIDEEDEKENPNEANPEDVRENELKNINKKDKPPKKKKKTKKKLNPINNEYYNPDDKSDINNPENFLFIHQYKDNPLYKLYLKKKSNK
jgi:hypothetical protein